MGALTTQKVDVRVIAAAIRHGASDYLKKSLASGLMHERLAAMVDQKAKRQRTLQAARG